MTTDSDDFVPLADRTVLGFLVLFLFGVPVGVKLAGAVLVWAGAVARALADPCEVWLLRSSWVNCPIQ